MIESTTQRAPTGAPHWLGGEVSESDASGKEQELRFARHERWRKATEVELVAAIRRGSYEALREFYARFEPLLARYAMRAGLSAEFWEERAQDVLGDVVLMLLEAEDRRQGSVRAIHGYVVRAFRNRMLDVARAARRRGEHYDDAASSDGEMGERMVLASISESGIRAAEERSEGERASTMSPALARLAAVLDASLTAEERLMLTWVSNAVPMREIAEWLGVEYSTGKVRLSRLRSRLRARAREHVTACVGAEQAELLDFIRRSGGGPREEARLERGRATAVREELGVDSGGRHGVD